jgi:cytochrome c biogenesis protein CcmG/thiol:disulfide interchange protein DsbE
MTRNRAQWIFVLVIVAGLGVGAWALTRFAPVPVGVEVGRRAPDFRALDLATGDSVSFHDKYAGKVTLVNIWATWCVPCRSEMPAMEALYKRLAPYGFRIAAVSVDDGSVDKVRDFGREYGLTFDLLHDKSGRIEQAYQTTGVPETVVVDKDGVIIRRMIGPTNWDSAANQRIIAQLLGIDLPGDSTRGASD